MIEVVHVLDRVPCGVPPARRSVACPTVATAIKEHAESWRSIFRRAVDLGLELDIYAYDAYILEGARSSGLPLLALDGPIGGRLTRYLISARQPSKMLICEGGASMCRSRK